MNHSSYHADDIFFNQTDFTQRNHQYLGKDSELASKEHGGLCQVYCSLLAVANQEWQKVIFKLLKQHSFQKTMELICPSQKFQPISGDEKLISIIFNFVEKISLKGHITTLMSSYENYKGSLFNEFPDSFITPQEQQKLLIEGRLNIPLFKKILERMDKDQKIQICLVDEPKLKNRFSFKGHAILLHKTGNKYCLFDPNHGFFYRDDPLEMAILFQSLILPSFNELRKSKHTLMGIVNLPRFITRLKDFKDVAEPISHPPDIKEWEFFLEKEAKNTQQFLNTTFKIQSRNISILCYAIRGGAALEHIKTLLEYGADVNLADDLNSPIHAAQEYHRPEVVQLLLEYGAKPTLKQLFSEYLFKDDVPDLLGFSRDSLEEKLNVGLAPEVDVNISQSLCHIIKKLHAKEKMEENDFQLLCQELQSINNPKIYKLLVFFINGLLRAIFDSYQNEIEDSVQQIRAFKPQEDKEVKLNQNVGFGLLNIYHLTHGRTIRGGAVSLISGIETPYEIFEYAVPFAINAFRLSNKLPKAGKYCGHDLSENFYSEDHFMRVIKAKKKWVPFSSPREKSDLESIYLLTNGKKILFLNKKPKPAPSIMASKIATFVSKDHFSSEDYVIGRWTASKELPAYKVACTDNEIQKEVERLIKTEKVVFTGTGIIDEVLDFIQDSGGNLKNYGFSTCPPTSQSLLSKIDFRYCNFSDWATSHLKGYYRMRSVEGLYQWFSYPQVCEHPKVIEERLYARLKLAMLTPELNSEFSKKSSTDSYTQKALASEASKRADFALDLFLEHKNSSEYLKRNPHIMDDILQESLKYSESHIDKTRLEEVTSSLRNRYQYIITILEKRLDLKLEKISGTVLDQKLENQTPSQSCPESTVSPPKLLKSKPSLTTKMFQGIMKTGNQTSNMADTSLSDTSYS